MTIQLVRGDAAHLPLPDGCVDLVVTSPPYFALRSYQDGGEHYRGQIGSEATPGEWLDAMLECTAEWVRVLKPSGSMWVDLGDGYDSRKSLRGLPWRYALRCIDDLGLILRAEVIWNKPNGLPESVTDRVRRSHEQWFHFVQRPRYYAAVDTIREPYPEATLKRYQTDYLKGGLKVKTDHAPDWIDDRIAPTLKVDANPLGKLPGSVWTVPSQPLTVPPELGVDHFAAFPMEWPRRIIQGWSPSGVCTGCGEGRRPVSTAEYVDAGGRGNEKWNRVEQGSGDYLIGSFKPQEMRLGRANRTTSITGECCACTPYTDHPGSGERSPIESSRTSTTGRHGTPGQNSRPHQNPVGPWREYHEWTPPPTRPAVVLDPFSGTGTVCLVADVLGRHGIGVDLSHDYNRLARWRTTDPGQRAAAMHVDKPDPVMDGQTTIFDML